MHTQRFEKVKWFRSIESEWHVCPFNIFFYEIKIFVIDEIQFLPFQQPSERVRGTIINNDVLSNKYHSLGNSTVWCQ